MDERTILDPDGAEDVAFFGRLETSSNLGKLFGVEAARPSEDSLKYQRTMPAPPDDPAQKSVEAALWTTRVAKVVYAFKDSMEVGKVGVALLKRNEAHKIIIYRSKATVMATLPLGGVDELSQIFLHGRYVQFYDEGRVFWSLCFDVDADKDEFLDHLRVAGVVVSVRAEEPLPAALPADSAVAEPVALQDSHLKVALLSRLAKVGKELPSLTAATAATDDYSDSSVFDYLSTPQRQAPPVAARRPQIMEAPLLQTIMADNRAQNMELRLDLRKLDAKMDGLCDRFEELRRGVTRGPCSEDEALELESKILALKRENLRLRTAAAEGRSGSGTWERLLDQHRSALAALGLDAKDEGLFASLLEKAARALAAVSESVELRRRLKETAAELSAAQVQATAAKARVAELEGSEHELRTSMGGLEGSNVELKAKLAGAPAAVATIMNSLYNSMSDRLDTMDRLGKDEVLAFLRRTIREQTMAGMTYFKQ